MFDQQPFPQRALHPPKPRAGLRASRTQEGSGFPFTRGRGLKPAHCSPRSVPRVTGGPSPTAASPTAGTGHCQPSSAFQGQPPQLCSTAHTINEGFISPFSCQLASRQPDSVNIRMLIFPLPAISKPKQHLELQLAIQRETDYNWKKLHISFPSFIHFCFYLDFPHVPSKTAPQGEEQSPLQRPPDTM